MTQNNAPVSQQCHYRTLTDLIESFSQEGHNPAILSLRKNDVQKIDRATLKKRIEEAAGALAASGVRKGDRVILWAGNSPEWVIACLAVIRAGGWIVPLDVQLESGTFERVVENCSPRLILTDEKRRSRLDKLSCDLPRILYIDLQGQDESFWQLQGESDLPQLKEDDGAVLFYTSGTTGPPKGVPLTHGNLTFQINRILQLDLAQKSDRLLLPLPLHHVYPFTVGLLLPLAARIPITLPHALTGPQILRAIKETQVTVICGVPRLYAALYDAINERFAARGKFFAVLFSKILRLSSFLRLKTGWNAGKILLFPLHRQIGPQLRLVASGGSALDEELARSLEGLGWQVVIGYGLTETSPLLTYNPPGSGRFDTVGKSIEGIELKLDKDKGDQEGDGEVLARGPSVFSHYYKMPEKSRQAFTEDGWFRTGDLGSIDEQGFLKLQGRASTLIVTESGENITPEEVEKAYEKSPQVKEIGVLEDEGRLVALIVPEDGTEQTDQEEISTALAQTAEGLPSYWQLSDIALTTRSLPRTRLGKIRRHLLEERYHKAKSGKEKAPRQTPLPVEEMSGEDQALLDNPAARATWDWLSGRYTEQGLSPDSHLQSDLNVDSLEWLTVTVEIGERTGVELDEETIAEIKTVRDLLEKVASEEQEGGKSFSGEPLKNPESVLSDEQKRWLSPPGWFLSQVRGPIAAFNRFVVKRYFNLQVSGLDNLPREQCVFTPNHLSSLDPFVLAAVLPQETLEKTWWGGWTGIAFHNPLTRAGSRLANAVPIDPERAVISSLAFAASVVRSEGNLVWFPEGQRSPDGKLQTFKPGIGLILERYPTVAVPVLIEGTGELLPTGRLWPRRGTVRITFGLPCDPRETVADTQSRREKADAIAATLQDGLQALQKKGNEGV